MTLGNFRVDHHHRHKTTLGSQPGRSRSLGRVSASNDALRTNDIVEYIIFPSPWFLRRPPIHKSIAWCLWSTGLSRGKGDAEVVASPSLFPVIYDWFPAWMARVRTEWMNDDGGMAAINLISFFELHIDSWTAVKGMLDIESTFVG